MKGQKEKEIVSIKDLKAGMVLDSIFNDALEENSKYRDSRIIKYAGKDVVVYVHREGGQEYCATRLDTFAWCNFKIREA